MELNMKIGITLATLAISLVPLAMIGTNVMKIVTGMMSVMLQDMRWMYVCE